MNRAVAFVLVMLSVGVINGFATDTGQADSSNPYSYTDDYVPSSGAPVAAPARSAQTGCSQAASCSGIASSDCSGGGDEPAFVYETQVVCNGNSCQRVTVRRPVRSAVAVATYAAPVAYTTTYHANGGVASYTRTPFFNRQGWYLGKLVHTRRVNKAARRGW